MKPIPLPHSPWQMLPSRTVQLCQNAAGHLSAPASSDPGLDPLDSSVTVSRQRAALKAGLATGSSFTLSEAIALHESLFLA